MKVEVYSDIHNEFRKLDGPWCPIGLDSEDKSDTVLVLAGDIDTDFTRLRNYLDYLGSRYKSVIYVPGNHEYYKKQFVKARPVYLNMSKDNIHVLDRRTVEIDDVQIIGATLWSDLYRDPYHQWNVKNSIADFHLIQYDQRKVTAIDMQYEYDRTLQYLKKKLSEGSYRKRVVVSHFPPSMKCKHSKWGDTMNTIGNYFYPSVPEDILAGVDTWIYGHSHDNVRINLMDCEITCNQVGYPGEKSEPVEQLILEI